MPVTEAQVKSLILLEVGDTSAGLLANQMDLIWQSYADKALVWPRLQELYSRRRCIDLALAEVRAQVDETSEGTQLRNEQRVTNLIDMRVEVEAEIGVLEERATANRAPQIAAITKAAPVLAGGPPPAYGLPPDANDPRYSGTPYAPLQYPWGYLP